MMDMCSRKLKRQVLAGVVLALMAGRLNGVEPVADMEQRYLRETAPIRMTYDITYRFLGMELGFLGRMELVTSTGKWRHRVSGSEIPVAFVDVRVRSRDCLKGGGGRTRIDDRIVAVLELPGLNALVFTKETDERLNPVFGRSSVSRAVSCYDIQSGGLEYCRRNLETGNTSTNLTAPEEIVKLSRRVGNVLNFLAARYMMDPAAPAAVEDGTIAVNLDGQVVRLGLLTRPATSPVCLDRKRFPVLHIETAMEKGAPVRAREFHAWGMLFSDLAAAVGDEELRKAAAEAPVNAMVPLVMDYELALGAVRVVMKGSGVEGGSPPLATGVERPEAVGDEHAAAGDCLGAYLGREGGHAKPVAKEPDHRL